MFQYLILGAIAALAVYSFFADSGDPGDRHPRHPRPYKPPSRPYESPRPLVPRRDERQNRQSIEPPRRDSSLVDDLRVKARREADLMARCYQRAREAYERRDHTSARALKEEGKRHEKAMKDLDARASASIYKENNWDKPACDLDLHGLYVKEAIAYSEKAVAGARRRGDSQIRLIVGKGNHSDGGISKLRPAIQEDMRARGIPVEVDPENPGVLLVRVGDM